MGYELKIASSGNLVLTSQQIDDIEIKGCRLKVKTAAGNFILAAFSNISESSQGYRAATVDYDKTVVPTLKGMGFPAMHYPHAFASFASEEEALDTVRCLEELSDNQMDYIYAGCDGVVCGYKEDPRMELGHPIKMTIPDRVCKVLAAELEVRGVIAFVLDVNAILDDARLYYKTSTDERKTLVKVAVRIYDEFRLRARRG